MSAQLTPLLITIPEAVRVSSLSRSTLYELLSSGEIKGIKSGRSRRIVYASLHDFVARLAGEPAVTAKSGWQVPK